MKKIQVYLAGGHYSGWQENVKIIDPDNKKFKFIDPSVNGSYMDFDEYSVWDLHQVKCADIVFAYMERENPSGIGLSVEIGYAKGLGKTVILVLEKNHFHFKDNHLSFMKSVADITYEDLDIAIEYLNSF